jgi:acyl dehydratase
MNSTAMETFRLPPTTVREMQDQIGREIGISPWRVVTQEMIDKFADATDDHQFIHVDPARAAATKDGGTIAHGLLTLSLLPAMAYEALRPLEHLELGVNQGFDSLRFLSPVRTGSRIRAHFTLARFNARPSGWIETGYDVTIEIEGGTRPALTLHWLTLSKVSPRK